MSMAAHALYNAAEERNKDAEQALKAAAKSGNKDAIRYFKKL
jgi:hypothetical protein